MSQEQILRGDSDPVSSRRRSPLWLRRLARPVRSEIDRRLVESVRVAASFANSRAAMNSVYRALTFSQKSAFHARFSRAFSRRNLRGGSGQWNVTFNGRRIRVPLRTREIALDWNVALALLGHDADVKATYGALLNSSQRPNLFVDIGANVAHLCAANGVAPCIEPVALGDRQCMVELAFPFAEPWLGSTDSAVSARLEADHVLVRQTVRQACVDDYLPEYQSRRILLKIDTEGGEAAVLRGAHETLQHLRPLVIFESRPGDQDERSSLLQLLDGAGYHVERLPWGPDARPQPLTGAQFVHSNAANFIGVPRPA